MEKKELICIGCPIGCMLSVECDHGLVSCISGNSCKVGADYARKEVSNPTRIVTTTVKVLDGTAPLVSVKTKGDIPKNKIFECMREIKSCTVKAPVHIGDVILANTAGTDIPVIATKTVERQDP
jgi:CxxC motif-containing protein